jgi:hypothetical protein
MWAGGTAEPYRRPMTGGTELALDHGLGSEVAAFIDPALSCEPVGHS